ncbi:glycoside hydrolase family 3 N-terminal domain-containing protein [Nocardioides marmoribigeumensis]|uniref:Beta-glucosidase n=1 Tax=Nocardioides marmoribigeumensis TaxID=433649 RepID=A0ABU2BYK5_9ACTN|nr:glycoside hydrolase family 3 N-terminal domain-containing protein [Nocardioides marmoribigeumensis]MDR7363475.1 beta-glucosidase [Nocardioides marmoribigeumensis]
MPRSLTAAAAATLVGGLLSLVGTSPATAGTDPACARWMDRRDSASERADALVGAMSLDQELHMLTFGDPPWVTYYGNAGHVDGIPELCVPDLVLSDAGSGVAGMHLATTVFPSGVAQASTWDPALERDLGRAIGAEAHSKGVNVMLAPGMNLARTPYNGRNFEYFGEDPHLSSEMTVPFIRGIQDNPVIADAKHFAFNEQEVDRMTIDTHVPERAARELYLAPFEAAVRRAGVGSIMCSYNRIDGKHACQNRALLTGILRRDWGFRGFVVSDWGATHSTAPSANAGMDLEMHAFASSLPATSVFGAGSRYYGADSLRAAMAKGSITRTRIDAMVRNITRSMFAQGLFDHVVAPGPVPYLSDVSTPEHRALARRVAAEATVMLKNHEHLLPLRNVDGGRTIAVVGYAANPVGAANSVSGGGSSRGPNLPPRIVSALEGIQAQAAAHGDRVVYVEGSNVEDARLAAQAADVAVVVATDGSSEGTDRPDLGLRPSACVTLFCQSVPLEQEKMIAAVTQANRRNVVVLDIGAPVRMPWLSDAGAVLVPWYGGAEHGNALGAVLYGELEPGGRLPQTFPRSERQVRFTPAQYPGRDGRVTYSEGLHVGYRWYDAQGVSPLFPFGFGLGYTTYSFRDLAVRRDGRGALVRVTVRNTGTRPGKAVPQVYVAYPARAGEPPRQLRGFAAVRLQPGESRRVTIHLPRRAFARWSPSRHAWVVTPGTYRVRVGTSSRHLPLRGRIEW